jgi:uncharacterized membrane protein
VWLVAATTLVLLLGCSYRPLPLAAGTGGVDGALVAADGGLGGMGPVGDADGSAGAVTGRDSGMGGAAPDADSGDSGDSGDGDGPTDLSVDPCQPNPCQNGATCVAVVGGQRCECTAGFVGDSCQFPMFQPLAIPATCPAGEESQASGISADGATVVGYCGSTTSSYRALRWSETSDALDLGQERSKATGANADGSVVVGFMYSMYDDQCCPPGGWRWTSASGFEALTPSPSTYLTGSNPAAVSADGGVIVGGGTDNTDQYSVLWTRATGLNKISVGFGYSSAASGVSADGTVVAGEYFDYTINGYIGYRWQTLGSDMVLLNPLGNSANVHGISADGAVIVGDSQRGFDMSVSFRWTAAAGMTAIGGASPGVSDTALSVSADGSVIVGQLLDATDQPAGATVWDAVHGQRPVSAVLSQAGADLDGWSLSSASAVSADGKVIAGWGMDGSGAIRAWRARMP